MHTVQMVQMLQHALTFLQYYYVIGALILGIVTGRVNPHGYRVGYERVRVRVGILLPVRNPYPMRG